MAAFRTLDDLEVAGRRVLVRVDFNVPLENGRVSDATRIERSLPTIRELAEKRARVVLLSHLGRPKGKRDPKASLEPVARALAEALPERRVVFAPECIGDEARAVVEKLGEGEVALLENLRFHAGEEANDEDFAEALAELGELYVDDAFAAAHRAHASVERLPRLLPAAAGRLMQAELESLTAALEDPKPPVAAVIAGAKVSTKLELLENLIAKVDVIILGGGMANTFLEAKGVEIGASLAERDMAETARALLVRAETAGRAGACEILLPTDAVVAARPEPGVETRVVAIDSVPEESMILDVGPRTVEAIEARLSDCRTLLWNGPLGLFEVPPFDHGTSAVARRVAELTRDGKLFSVAGGGDTLAALAKAGADADFSYLSTAGGAFLEWLEGKTLPGVAALEAAAR